MSDWIFTVKKRTMSIQSKINKKIPYIKNIIYATKIFTKKYVSAPGQESNDIQITEILYWINCVYLLYEFKNMKI